MKRTSISLLLFSICSLCLFLSRAEGQTATSGQAANYSDIRVLLAKMHIQELSVSSMKEMMDQLKTQKSEMPAELFNRFESKFDSIGAVVVDSIIPIYAKYYTASEIEQLNKVYDLPIMQKSLQVSPQLMSESMTVGSKIGRETMTGLATDYFTEHPADIPDSAPTAPKRKKKK